MSFLQKGYGRNEKNLGWASSYKVSISWNLKKKKRKKNKNKNKKKTYQNLGSHSCSITYTLGQINWQLDSFKFALSVKMEELALLSTLQYSLKDQIIYMAPFCKLWGTIHPFHQLCGWIHTGTPQKSFEHVLCWYIPTKILYINTSIKTQAIECLFLSGCQNQGFLFYEYHQRRVKSVSFFLRFLNCVTADT